MTCDPKVTVWCAVRSRGDIGPCLFEDDGGQAITVTSQRYTELINEFLVLKLPPNRHLWFQQDVAAAHTAVISVGSLGCLCST
jgi:hypothetical protein